MSYKSEIRKLKELQREMGKEGYSFGETKVLNDGSTAIKFFKKDSSGRPIIKEFLSKRNEPVRPYDYALYTQSMLNYKTAEKNRALSAQDLKLKNKSVNIANRDMALKELQVGFTLARVVIPIIGMFIVYMIIVGLGAAGLNFMFSGNNMYYFIGIILALLFFIKKRKN